MNTRTIKFLQGSLSLACAAALTFSLRAGNDYYVDAVNGNDLWDGSTAAIPSVEQQRLETVPGPRKTLAGAMAIEGLTSGDTVHAAPGPSTIVSLFGSIRTGSSMVCVPQLNLL